MASHILREATSLEYIIEHTARNLAHPELALVKKTMREIDRMQKKLKRFHVAFVKNAVIAQAAGQYGENDYFPMSEVKKNAMTYTVQNEDRYYN
jgi:hypothetical protein